MDAIEINRKPTTNDPTGTYKLIINGIYWGIWYVGENWLKEKYVTEANPVDGLPN